MKDPTYELAVVPPISMAIKNNDDPFITEGKGWFADELVDWKIIFEGLTNVKNWFGGHVYKNQTLVLDGLGKYKFLGVEMKGDCFMFDVCDPSSLIDDRKSYIIFKEINNYDKT